jgi:prepilin-type N-terminal cleavage/methylation domain-containing protein
MQSRKGFTLLEILVVVGILGALLAVLVHGFSGAPKKAERAKCETLVKNAADALTIAFDKNGAWPEAILKNHNSQQGLDGDVAVALAQATGKAFSVNVSGGRAVGLDRFGIVSPWATSVLKAKGNSASLSTKVPTGGTIQDHRLRYAIDLDGDGVIEGASVGGESVDIRATAAVWCCGMDGKLEAYSVGQRKDDVYSWTDGQTKNVR